MGTNSATERARRRWYARHPEQCPPERRRNPGPPPGSADRFVDGPLTWIAFVALMILFGWLAR